MSSPIHGVLLVDKPRGPTSHDVVALVRRKLKMKKVGHAGTLDPAAEGLVLVAVGRATKRLSELQTTTKRYVAHIVLGSESVTNDIEGPLIPVAAASMPDERKVAQALEQFRGQIRQVPPAYSAIKQGGDPLYRRARKGEVVEPPPRLVEVFTIATRSYSYPDLLADIECSSGTYIRSIARDVGRALKTGAYLHALLRVSVGAANLDKAWTVDEIQHLLTPESWSLMSLHIDLASPSERLLVLDEHDLSAWYHGRLVRGDSDYGQPGTAIAYDANGMWLGIATREKNQPGWHPGMVVPASNVRSS